MGDFHIHNMDLNLVLSKESSANEIRQYFNAILELSRSENDFPVNLDNVWPLVYSRKEEAVRTLQRNFIQHVDYQVLRKKAENLSGGRPTVDYYLTIPCLEFFIARKVRSVFEVYRQVFHNQAHEQYADRIGYPSLVGDTKFVFSTAGLLPHEIYAYLRALRTMCGMDERTAIDMLTEMRPQYKDMSEFIVMAEEVSGLLGLSQEAMRLLFRRMAASLSLPFPKNFEDTHVEQMPLYIDERKSEAAAKVISCKRRIFVPEDPSKGKLPHRLLPPGKLLLDTRHLHISVCYLNEKLVSHGFIRKVLDETGKRGEWQVTLTGERYGANTQVRHGVPMRPRYWTDTFEDMLREIGLYNE